MLSLCAGLLLLAPSPLARAQNLVQNPGFETGDFTDWTTTPAAAGSLFLVTPTPLGIASSGTHSAGFGAVMGLDDTISQTLATAPAEEYIFSFWVKNTPLFGGSYLTASWNNQALLTITPATTEADWTKYQFTETATGPATISFAGHNLTDFAYVDDVRVTAAVPDSPLGRALPALLLFGLCAFGGRWRRHLRPALAGAALLAAGAAGPAWGQAAPDFDLCFQGYNPNLPGSSVQLDLQSAHHLVRLTAWTAAPGIEFQDYNVDLAPQAATLWLQTPAAGGGWLLSVKSVNAAGNFRLDAEIKLPYGIGTVSLQPLNPALPMANVPFSGPVNWIVFSAPQVADPALSGADRPMPFGVFDTVTPTVSVPLVMLTESLGRVYWDDGWSDGSPSLDITSMFTASGYAAVAPVLPFRYGANRLTVVFPDGGRFSTYSMNYDDTTLGLVEPAISTNLAYWELSATDAGGQSELVLANAAKAYFPEGTTTATISSFFRQYRLRPIGYAQSLSMYLAFVDGNNLTGDKNGNGQTDLFDYCETGAARRQGPEGLLIADFIYQPGAYSESIQASISVANANNYSVMTRGWAGLPGAMAPQANAWAGEHFWMQTFPAQRVLSAWADVTFNGATPANLPVIGVFDSGLGFSAMGRGAAFPNNDLPLNLFNDLWLLSDELNANPMRINAGAGMVAIGNVQDQRLNDRVIGGGHGTAVAHFAGAQGALQKQGTGRNVTFSIMKNTSANNGSFTSSVLDTALSVTVNNPQVRVLNLSNGGTVSAAPAAAALVADKRIEAELQFDQMSREGVACIMAAGNAANEIFPANVPPAAGDRIPTPGLVAPLRGRRNASTDTAMLVPNMGLQGADRVSPLVMRVAGLDLPNMAVNQEAGWVNSGNGGNVSVAAAADDLTGVTRFGLVDPQESGTSFATPMVSGLLAEIIRIQDLRQGAGPNRLPPANAAARRARAALVRQAIEIVEATADRVLGSNPAANFDAAEQAPNNQMGFGRINVWKAVLTAMSGGLAAGGTDQGAAPLGFGTLAQVNAANTVFYGFDLRLRSDIVAKSRMFDGAVAWLNENPFDDNFATPATLANTLNDTSALANTDFTGANGGAAVRNIIAFKRTASLNSRLPTGFDATVAFPNGVTEMAFSAHRTNVTATAPVPYKRLELRRNGQTAMDQPFFTVPLNIARLRNNAAGAGGNGTNIRFDDYVFEILCDHTVALNVAEVRGIAASTNALAAADEVQLTATLTDEAGNNVNGSMVDFIVCNAQTGAADATGQIRLRATRGANPVATSLSVATAGAGAASVFVTRIAGAGGAAPVTTRILVRVNPMAAGGAAMGAQFPQEFTVPVRP